MRDARAGRGGAGHEGREGRGAAAGRECVCACVCGKEWKMGSGEEVRGDGKWGKRGEVGRGRGV